MLATLLVNYQRRPRPLFLPPNFTTTPPSKTVVQTASAGKFALNYAYALCHLYDYSYSQTIFRFQYMHIINSFQKHHVSQQTIVYGCTSVQQEAACKKPRILGLC